MGRYALCWSRRNEIGELERRERLLTPEEARALIESKDDYWAVVKKLTEEQLDDRD